MGLGEMFEGYSADTRAEKFPLVSMGGRAEGLACADLGARTPSALAEIFSFFTTSPGGWAAGEINTKAN